MPPTWHVRDHRIVFTYAPDGPALGLVTGYEAGTLFVVEHVVVFPGTPGSALLKMARLALAEGWQHYATIIFCLPKAWVMSRRLRLLGEYLGFVPYAETETLTWYCAWKP